MGTDVEIGDHWIVLNFYSTGEVVVVKTSGVETMLSGFTARLHGVFRVCLLTSRILDKLSLLCIYFFFHK